MLAQTQSMVREGKWRGREKETELERKRGKKEAALGFASGRAHSSNIDSVLLFFFSFYCVRSPHIQLSLSLYVSLVHILEN